MSERTVLQIAQQFCARQGLPTPASVANASDDTTQQIFGLMNEGIEDLVDRFYWQQIRQRISFVHANGPDYTAIDFSTTYPDFKGLVPDTFWDTSSRLPVLGPMTPSQWAQMLALSTAPSRSAFRLYGNALRIYPVNTSLTYALEYYSRYGVYGAGDAVPASKQNYTADTDRPLLPDAQVLADLRWRYQMTKGLPYAEAQRISEEMMTNAGSREPTPDIEMGTRDAWQSAVPGIFVSPGSWPL